MMYVILTSKPGQFRTEAGPEAEIVEAYDYFFYGQVKAVFEIAKLDREIKIRVVEDTPPHVVNHVPSRFFGQFRSVEAARRELARLAGFGSLDTALVKRS